MLNERQSAILGQLYEIYDFLEIWIDEIIKEDINNTIRRGKDIIGEIKISENDFVDIKIQSSFKIVE